MANTLPIQKHVVKAFDKDNQFIGYVRKVYENPTTVITYIDDNFAYTFNKRRAIAVKRSADVSVKCDIWRGCEETVLCYTKATGITFQMVPEGE